MKSITTIEYIAEISLPATGEEFSSSKNFTTENKEVNIYYICDSFTQQFIEVNTINPPMPQHNIHSGRLIKPSSDIMVIQKLGGFDFCKVNLAEIFSLMKMQPNGEIGQLSVSYPGNIFYTKYFGYERWCIFCRWRNSIHLKSGWEITATPVCEEIVCGKDALVFSKNHFKSA